VASSLRTLSIALTVLAAAPALAQAPGALSPGLQLQEGLQSPSPPTGQPPQAPSQPQAPEAEPGPRPDVNLDTPVEWSGVIRFRGITEQGFAEARLPAAFLRMRDDLRAELLGLREKSQLTIGSLETLTTARTEQLRRQGYLTSLVLALPNGSEDGANRVPVMDLVIVASFISKVEPVILKGGKDLKAHVLKMIQPVVGGDGPKLVFNENELNRQVRLINTFGSVNVQWKLRRGDVLGESVLIPVIKATPLRASLLLDNNVPLQLGTWRLGASLLGYVPSSQPVRISARADNAFSVPGGFVFGTVQASTPIGNEGWTADVLWATTSTNSKDLAIGPATLETGGISNYYALGLNYPLVARENGVLSVGLKGTIQNSTNDLYLNDQHVLDLNTDRIRAVRLSLDGYAFNWEQGALAWSRLSQLNVVLSQGFSGLDSGLEVGEVLSNIYGQPNFTTARLYLTHHQLIGGSPNNGTILSLIGTGQASRSALPVPEQFVYGGTVIGRGFNSAYILGDQGWAASLELGQRITVARRGNAAARSSLWPFIWYDYGFTSYRSSALPNQAASTYGIGARGTLNSERNSFELGWGIPGTNTLQPSKTGAGNGILYFRLSYGF